MKLRGFHVGECYLCGQGNVYICKSENTGKVFLACEECDSEWPSPDEFLNHHTSDKKEGGRYLRLSKEEISQHPWKVYVENRFDLEG